MILKIILIVELINVYIEIIIFSEIYDSPTSVTEHRCNTGMKTMLTFCFELVRNLLIYFLIPILETEIPKLNHHLSPGGLVPKISEG